MERFNQVVEKHFEKLDVFTTAITRAHGKSHPEAFEVRELFEAIQSKVKEAGGKTLDLAAEFTKLRQVTNDYKIPNDVCGTYVDTYRMLERADETYHAS